MFTLTKFTIYIKKFKLYNRTIIFKEFYEYYINKFVNLYSIYKNYVHISNLF